MPSYGPIRFSYNKISYIFYSQSWPLIQLEKLKILIIKLVQEIQFIKMLGYSPIRFSQNLASVWSELAVNPIGKVKNLK